jgi:soluble lytic murein transglycosylase-like protein
VRFLLAAALTVAAAAALAARKNASGQGSAFLLPDGWQDAGSFMPAALFDASTEPSTIAEPDEAPTLLDTMKTAIVNTFALWRPPAQYAVLIALAEDRHGIPRDILARLLYQECRWREDIITGRLASPAGALGIAQFMPATAAELGVDPLNPAQAIDGAGRYLAMLYRQTGTWALALAAYNWGIGNVKRRGLAAAPRETRDYYSQILSDVNQADGTAWA